MYCLHFNILWPNKCLTKLLREQSSITTNTTRTQHHEDPTEVSIHAVYDPALYRQKGINTVFACLFVCMRQAWPGTHCLAEANLQAARVRGLCHRPSLLSGTLINFLFLLFSFHLLVYSSPHAHTHTHTCVCVYECVCECV